MKIWQISASGEGFERGGVKAGFELNGFIQAEGPDEAFSKAVVLAKARYPEIAQADKPNWPKPVINAEEIEDASGLHGIEVDTVEVYWDDEETV